MGRSNYLNVDCARSQEAYYAKIRAAVFALRAGTEPVTCPRESCGEVIEATEYGSMLTLRCPHCGLIFRGNGERLMQYFE